LKRLFPCIVILAAFGCSGVTGSIEFGNMMARKGLWKEAAFRWKQALKTSGPSAVIYNNLAIAHEHAGEREEARAAYEKALSMDPGNPYIKKNHDRFLKGPSRGREPVMESDPPKKEEKR